VVNPEIPIKGKGRILESNPLLNGRPDTRGINGACKEQNVIYIYDEDGRGASIEPQPWMVWNAFESERADVNS
jgi:hypothetical protein